MSQDNYNTFLRLLKNLSYSHCIRLAFAPAFFSRVNDENRNILEWWKHVLKVAAVKEPLFIHRANFSRNSAAPANYSTLKAISSFQSCPPPSSRAATCSFTLLHCQYPAWTAGDVWL